MSNTIKNTKLTFILGDKIGSGGASQVFRAHDIQLNAEIAVKQMPKSDFKDPQMFFEESRKLYLSNHHNIVNVFHSTVDDDYIYLSMPYYHNGSLKSLIDRKFLTSREIIRYSLQFLSGLNNIHSKGLIHFDIKLENILINSSNQALITDFGQAEHTCQFGFSENSGTTHAFAPPEFFKQEKHNLKFDIYQAGLSMYRLCNGDKDFLEQFQSANTSVAIKKGSTFIDNIKKEIFPNRKKYLDHIPIQLRKIVTTALKANPEDRYSSVIEILNDLSKIETASDWRYTGFVKSIEEWYNGNRIVTCEKNGNDFTIQAKKNGRMVNKFCCNSVKEPAKKDLLKRCFKEKW